MRKLLLTLSLALTLLGVRAESLSYGICTETINTVGTGSPGTNYSAAIEVPEAVAKALAGNKVTAVSIGFGSGLAKVANIYLTYDLTAEPFYTQQEKKLKVNHFNDVELTTPYVIEGKKFYIGYTYRQSSSSGKPIGFDGVPHPGLDSFSHLAVYGDDGTPEWLTYPQFGALTLRATIEGDNFPTASAVPYEITLPDAVGVGKEFNYSVSVYNLSNTPINSLSVSSAFGSAEAQSQNFDLAEPIAPGAVGTVKLSATTDEENMELPVKASVSTVNGAENLWAAQPLSTTVVASDFVFPRVIVIEEGTGVDCGWCPAGYVALEQMREKNLDDYIGIAVHNYGYPADPMHCASYISWEDWVHPKGYPFATLNRLAAVGYFSPQPSTCENLYNEFREMINIGLDITAKYADESKENLDVTVTTRFGQDIPSLNYGIALVQTEDNVGPYNQKNNFAGGGSGEMFGFEKEGAFVSLTYNDVARSTLNWNGKDGSIPTSVKKGEDYIYTEKMPILPEHRDDGGLTQKHGDTNVIALLINRNDNSIITAAKCHIEGTTPSVSVDAVSNAAPAKIIAGAGEIAVVGEFTAATVYTTAGVKVASLKAADAVSVPAGLYIVRVEAAGADALVRKVIVK